ncbi:MAG: hypothetical protein NW205_06945 [Hyphomicrobiaceae bacterium]|nr:hypothetical protein [Hyphomicrobiaceae bacterium]
MPPEVISGATEPMLTPVIQVLVTGIHLSESLDARCPIDPGNAGIKCRDWQMPG